MTDTQPTAPRNSRAGTVVSVRFSDDEINRLKAVADREGVPLSVVIRRALAARNTEPYFSAPAPASNSTPVGVEGRYDAYGGAVQLQTVPSATVVTDWRAPASA